MKVLQLIGLVCAVAVTTRAHADTLGLVGLAEKAVPESTTAAEETTCDYCKRIIGSSSSSSFKVKVQEALALGDTRDRNPSPEELVRAASETCGSIAETEEACAPSDASKHGTKKWFAQHNCCAFRREGAEEALADLWKAVKKPDANIGHVCQWLGGGCGMTDGCPRDMPASFINVANAVDSNAVQGAPTPGNTGLLELSSRVARRGLRVRQMQMQRQERGELTKTGAAVSASTATATGAQAAAWLKATGCGDSEPLPQHKRVGKLPVPCRTDRPNGGRDPSGQVQIYVFKDACWSCPQGSTCAP